MALALIVSRCGPNLSGLLDCIGITVLAGDSSGRMKISAALLTSLIGKPKLFDILDLSQKQFDCDEISRHDRPQNFKEKSIYDTRRELLIGD